MASEAMSTSFMRLICIRTALCFFLPTLVLLASCNSSVTCLPAEMTKQIAAATPPRQPGDQVTSVGIYLDVSSSMRGYLNSVKTTEVKQPQLPAMIRDLPSVAFLK